MYPAPIISLIGNHEVDSYNDVNDELTNEHFNGCWNDEGSNIQEDYSDVEVL